jgi:hypothetical protein
MPIFLSTFKGLIYEDFKSSDPFTSHSRLQGEFAVANCSRKLAIMNPQTFHRSSYEADGLGQGSAHKAVRSSFCIMPATVKPSRNNSFILGLSDSRIRPLLNQDERDRLHCWSMIVALSSSIAGTTLLLTAILR